MSANILQGRRDSANFRLRSLQSQLNKSRSLARGKACVYVTGSFGRGEASKYSDLDLFIVGRGKKEKPTLFNLDQILIKGDLIETTRKLGFLEFSGDGEYLVHYTVDDLISTLGKPEDDVTNTFTARLLLLLESRPLLEKRIHSEAISKVIGAYWKDYEDHRDDFVPAFLVNDILRLWRTFCVNYEARTETDSKEKKAKRKLMNYKLKYSRLLTCYSAIVYLMAVLDARGTVSQDDAKAMVALSPIRRLEWLQKQQRFASLSPNIKKIISLYSMFLGKTGNPKSELIKMFLNDRKTREAFEEAKSFGGEMFRLLNTMGKGNKIYRLLVV